MRYLIDGNTCHDADTAMAVLGTKVRNEVLATKIVIEIVPGAYTLRWGHPETHSRNFETAEEAIAWASMGGAGSVPWVLEHVPQKERN